MKKKFGKLLSIMMAIALMVMYLPKSESVFAAAEPDAPLNFTSPETTTTGTGYEWVQEDKTLTINGLDINTGSFNAITLPADSTIVVSSDSIIESDTCCIRCEGDLTVKGSAQLVCNSDDVAVRGNGGNCNLNISGAHLKAETSNEWAHAIEFYNINVSDNGVLIALKSGSSGHFAINNTNINVTNGLVVNDCPGSGNKIYIGFDGTKTLSNVLAESEVTSFYEISIYKGILDVHQTPSGKINIYDGTTVKNSTGDTINIYDSELYKEIAIPASESYTSVTPELYSTLTPTEKPMTESGISFEGNVATDGEFAKDRDGCLGKTALYKITGLTVGNVYDFKLTQENSNNNATQASYFYIMKDLTGDIDNDSIINVCSNDLSPINTLYTATQSEVYVLIYNYSDYENAPFTFTVNEKIYDTVSPTDNGDIYIMGTQNKDDSISLKYLLSENEPTTWENAKTIDEENPLEGIGALNKDIHILLGEIHKNEYDYYPDLNLYVKDLDLGTGKIILSGYEGDLVLKGNSFKATGIDANKIIVTTTNIEIKDVTAKSILFGSKSAKITGNVKCDVFNFNNGRDYTSDGNLIIAPTAVFECEIIYLNSNITNEGKLIVNNGSNSSNIYAGKIVNKGTFINKSTINASDSSFNIENTGLIVNDGTITAGDDEDAHDICANDCTLSAMTVNGGDLTPIFDRENGCYTMSVAEDVDSIKLTPTLNEDTRTLKVNGEVVASGSESQAINLATGENTILITISDEEYTNTYKIVVTRGNPIPTPAPTPTYTPDPHQKETTTEKIEEVAKNLEDGDKLTIKPTTENKELKGDTLKEIKGKDVKVNIEVADGIEWLFNGKDIPEDWNAKDIKFGIDTEKSNIPTEKLKTFTAGKKSKTLSLDYDGEFGFEMQLSVHIGYLNDGQYANIYYYNPETKELEFMGSSKINGAGNAKFDFKHASDYVILVSDKPEATASGADTTNDNSTTTASDTSESNPKTGDTTPIVIATLSLGAIAIILKKKLVK